MKSFTPRHMRKKFAKKGGVKDKQKQLAFKRAAKWSKRFIHLSAAACINAGQDYLDWCGAADRDALRRASK